jgi:hypothetical protein
MSETAPTQPERHLELLRTYLHRLERFESPRDLFHPDMVQTEHPNRINPTGTVREPRGMGADLAGSTSIISAQSYEVRSAIVAGDRLAAQLLWRGTMVAPMGDLQVGDEMICHSGVFIEFKDGLIWRQENYDCFPPF